MVDIVWTDPGLVVDIGGFEPFVVGLLQEDLLDILVLKFYNEPDKVVVGQHIYIHCQPHLRTSDLLYCQCCWLK